MFKKLILFQIVALSMLSNTLIAETQVPRPIHHAEDGKTFKNLEPDIPLQATTWEMLGNIWQLLFQPGKRIPKVKLPEMKPDLAQFEASHDSFQFVWFGHSTLLWRIDDVNILVDPVFSGNAGPVPFFTKRYQPPALSLEELPKIDAIIISHNHYDHLDKGTVKFFADKDTLFLVPLKIRNILKDFGVREDRIVELDWDQTYSIRSVDFTATIAHHFTGRGLFDAAETLWASWVVKSKTKSIYYSGDTAYKKHFKTIGDKYGPFDIAFMENGQYHIHWPDAHMQPEESIQAVLDVRAAAMVPVHWGMFDLSLHHWSEPVVRSSKLAKEKGVRFVSPLLGERVELDAMRDFHPWWEDVLKAEAEMKD